MIHSSQKEVMFPVWALLYAACEFNPKKMLLPVNNPFLFVAKAMTEMERSEYILSFDKHNVTDRQKYQACCYWHLLEMKQELAPI